MLQVSELGSNRNNKAEVGTDKVRGKEKGPEREMPNQEGGKGCKAKQRDEGVEDIDCTM